MQLNCAQFNWQCNACSLGRSAHGIRSAERLVRSPYCTCACRYSWSAPSVVDVRYPGTGGWNVSHRLCHPVSGDHESHPGQLSCAIAIIDCTPGSGQWLRIKTCSQRVRVCQHNSAFKSIGPFVSGWAGPALIHTGRTWFGLSSVFPMSVERTPASWLTRHGLWSGSCVSPRAPYADSPAPAASARWRRAFGVGCLVPSSSDCGLLW